MSNPNSCNSAAFTLAPTSFFGLTNLTCKHQGRVGRPLATGRPNQTRMVVAMPKPLTKPASPCFSSGPVKKHPGFDIGKNLADAAISRSHRSKLAKAKMNEAVARSNAVLRVPEGYRTAIVPGSDTGAVEMCMWSMLGQRPVDVCHWDSFGFDWWTDAQQQLKLDNLREFTSDEFGVLPDLSDVNKDHDVVFTFNATASGVRVPDGCDFIADDRTGLSICDGTSAVFGMDIPWHKIDVLTYSWAKVLGGEAAHGMIILSPRAVERLETYTPPRALPKVFRMTKNGKIDEAMFKGHVINTVSMLCVEDFLNSIKWCEDIGGLDGLIDRSMTNLAVVEDFVQRNSWVRFIAQDKATRSNTSVTLKLDMPDEKIKELEEVLAKEDVAYDINSYRNAPKGLRIWCGATVQEADLKALMHWIEWAHDLVMDA